MARTPSPGATPHGRPIHLKDQAPIENCLSCFFQKENGALKTALEERSGLLSLPGEIETNLQEILEAKHELYHMMGFDSNGTESKTLTFLSFCTNISSFLPTTNFTSFGTSESTVDYSSFSWLRTDEHSECPQEFTNWKQRFRNIPHYSKVEFGNKLSALLDILQKLSGSSIQQCVSQIGEVRMVVLGFQNTLNPSIQMLSADTYFDAIQIGFEIVGLFQQFLVEASSLTSTSVGDECKILTDWVENIQSLSRFAATELQAAQELFQKGKDVLLTVGEFFEPATRKYLAPLANLTRGYTLQQITKLEWAQEFSGQKNQQSKILLKSENEKVKNGIHTISSFLTRGTKKLEDLYKQLLSGEEVQSPSQPSALTLSTFQGLHLARAAKHHNPVHTCELAFTVQF